MPKRRDEDSPRVKRRGGSVPARQWRARGAKILNYINSILGPLGGPGRVTIYPGEGLVKGNRYWIKGPCSRCAPPRSRRCRGLPSGSHSRPSSRFYRSLNRLYLAYLHLPSFARRTNPLSVAAINRGFIVRRRDFALRMNVHMYVHRGMCVCAHVFHYVRNV